MIIAISQLATAPLSLQTDSPSEPSGVKRAGAEFYIVSDNIPGTYYRIPIPASGRELFPLRLENAQPVALPHSRFAIDLEGIDILADGRVVVLSERLRCLIDKNGIVAEYDDSLGEYGGRGLEGLAVREHDEKAGTSQVAVLWEGGYPQRQDVPVQLRNHLPWLLPLVFVHELEREVAPGRVRMSTGRLIPLHVPVPDGTEPFAQRYRATDLVWHRMNGEWGFIVLLNPHNNFEEDLQYESFTLQRFLGNGVPYGDPIYPGSLHENSPEMQRGLKWAAWEGLDWYEVGETLVLVHDESISWDGEPYALIVPLPPTWRE